MAAQLGTTSDPKALIPGNPETVAEAASKLGSRASTLEDIGNGLGKVRTDGWVGAASDGFHESLAAQKPNWLSANDAVKAAGELISGYGDTLSWAQRKAADAIDMWERAEAATQRATTAHHAALKSPSADPSAPTPTFHDPGEAIRKEAKELLERARKQLKQSGDEIAGKLGAKGGKSRGAPPWLTVAASVVQTAIKDAGGKVTGAQDLFGTGDITDPNNPLAVAARKKFGYDFGTTPAGAKGPDLSIALARVAGEKNLAELARSGQTNLGGADLSGTAGLKAGVGGDASLAVGSNGLTAAANARAGVSAYAQGQARYGGLTASGSAEAFAGAQAGATATVGPNGLAAGANASAGVSASAQGQVDYGIAGAGASGNAFAGAEADANVSVGKDGVHAGAGAFAGARAEGEVHGDVGGVGGGVKGEAWAGVGAEADVTFGKGEDGKWHIGGEAGAGVGVGGKVGGEVTVDPGKVVDSAHEVADKAGDAAHKAGEVAGEAKHKAGEIAGKLNPFD